MKLSVGYSPMASAFVGLGMKERSTTEPGMLYGPAGLEPEGESGAT